MMDHIFWWCGAMVIGSAALLTSGSLLWVSTWFVNKQGMRLWRNLHATYALHVLNWYLDIYRERGILQMRNELKHRHDNMWQEGRE